MNDFVLVKPSVEYAQEICAYRQEMLDHNSPFDGCGGLGDLDDIEAWITQCRLCEKEETKPKPEWVVASQFMLVQKGDDRILGMINLRHYLNDFLAEYGGHIGYSVRPTERRRGYAKVMLALCLEECRKLGLERVLLTCYPDNKGSYKTIEACGGQFERITQKDGTKYSRYWTAL